MESERIWPLFRDRTGQPYSVLTPSALQPSLLPTWAPTNHMQNTQPPSSSWNYACCFDLNPPLDDSYVLYLSTRPLCTLMYWAKEETLTFLFGDVADSGGTWTFDSSNDQNQGASNPLERWFIGYDIPYLVPPFFCDNTNNLDTFWRNRPAVMVKFIIPLTKVLARFIVAAAKYGANSVGISNTEQATVLMITQKLGVFNNFRLTAL